MAHFFKSLTVLAIFFGQTLSALMQPGPGEWEFSGSYLYWLPSVDDTYFVISSPTASTGPSGKRENNDFGFHSGFRIEGGYTFCDCEREFHINYLRLRAHVDRSVSSDHLWATIGSGAFVSNFEDYSGLATARNDLLFQRVQAVFSQRIGRCPSLDFFLYGGFEYDHIRIRENLRYERTSGEGLAFGEVGQKSRLWGIGPNFGGQFCYDLCSLSCFFPGRISLVGTTSGSLLVSQSTISSLNINPATTNIDVRDHHTWRIIPSWQTRLAVNWMVCFPCLSAILEVGYELDTYIRAINWQAFPNSNDSGLCYTAYKNFDVHGVDVTLEFIF